MKRFLLLTALLACSQTLLGAGRATEILDKLAAGFRASGSYTVAFEVQADDFTTSGHYDVKGEDYYMQVGAAEVFCDGTIRYEVDNDRREVTVTGVDSASRNILNNPVHAFDFLESQYTSALVSEVDGKAVVRLTPVSGSSSPAGEVTVTVLTAAMRPLSLAYDFDGQRITISIRSVDALKSPLNPFDKAAFAGYEFIDFR